MKPFPDHDPEWVDSLPFYGYVRRDTSGRLTCVEMAGLFPGSRCWFRDDIEAGHWPGPNVTPEERDFNRIMTQQIAAFADIVAEYTRWLCGRERTIALFKILTLSWNRRGEPAFGTRAWFHGVCREAVPPKEFL